MNAGDPYQPPSAPLEFASAATSDVVAVREAHIGHERKLKSVGLLFGLGAATMMLVLVALLIPGDSGGPELTRQMAGVVAAAMIIALIAGALAVLAFGYRTLAPWVKYVGTPVSAMGLLAVPLGTLIHAYVLYLIWSKKGRRVLAPGYAEIIRATPNVRYKSTVRDWIALALLVLLVVGFVAMQFLA